MILIDGNKIAREIKAEIAEEVKLIEQKGGKTPHLAAILVGHDGGSESYVAFKIKDCAEVGFKSSLYRYEDDVTEAELLAKIDELNRDQDVDGFIVQLPLPKHISEPKVIEAIDYKKDVDGFHPINVGRMVIGLPSFISATSSNRTSPVSLNPDFVAVEGTRVVPTSITTAPSLTIFPLINPGAPRAAIRISALAQTSSRFFVRL